jgi:hypothetical protein
LSDTNDSPYEDATTSEATLLADEGDDEGDTLAFAQPKKRSKATVRKGKGPAHSQVQAERLTVKAQQPVVATSTGKRKAMNEVPEKYIVRL